MRPAALHLVPAPRRLPGVRAPQWLVLVALVALAAPAAAGGIALRWTNCVADGGTSNVAFACDTNTGTRVLVPSFVLDAPIANVMSIRGVVDVVADSPTLPAWWDLAGCRSGSLGVLNSAVGPLACTIWPANSDGINYYLAGASGPNTARFEFSAIRTSTSTNIPTGTEFIVAPLRINLTRTVGSPSCAGCGTGVCVTLTGLTFGSPGGSVIATLTTPMPTPDGTLATWQGGGSGPGGNCAAVVTTRRSTWGAVRSLYR